MNDLRLDPLRQTWTIFSGTRTLPPKARRRAEAAPSPFTRGREAFAPHTLYAAPSAENWLVRVVPNRAPALRIEGRTGIFADGFYDHADGLGAHEVVIETPGSEPLEALPLPHVELVVEAWKKRMLDLMHDARLRSFFIVKNVGALAGAHVAHAVSQLVVTAIVPTALKQKLRVARDFYEHKGRSIFDDILREEVRVGSRLVYENNGFAVFCPYASRTPFEMAVYPKRQCADFHGLSDQELKQFADALRTALRKLAGALDTPAYNLTLLTAPTRTARRDYWNTIDADFRWHAEIVPRLFPDDGIALATGCPVNFVLPETAAEHLRKVEA